MIEQVFTLPGTKQNHPGQGTVYLAMPENAEPSVQHPLLVAVHGSNRSALDYRDTPFYCAQRDIALSHGCVFATISNGLDTWGLDDGLFNLNLLIDYLTEHYPVTGSAILWSTSAGGTLAARMIKEHPKKVSFVLGTFPVYDLRSSFRLNSCKKAWHTEDFSEFCQRIHGKNPAEFPELLKDHPIYITHGTDDTAVPFTEHANRICSDVGSSVRLEVVPGGIHGIADFSYYGTLVDTAFREQGSSWQ